MNPGVNPACRDPHGLRAIKTAPGFKHRLKECALFTCVIHESSGAFTSHNHSLSLLPFNKNSYTVNIHPPKKNEKMDEIGKAEAVRLTLSGYSAGKVPYEPHPPSIDSTSVANRCSFPRGWGRGGGTVIFTPTNSVYK